MKTKVFSILAVLMLIITVSFASDPQSNLQQTVRDQILISYPEFAIEKQLEGSVFVEFTITTDGEIIVTNCNSLVGELQSYVYEKLSSMKVTIDPKLSDKTYLKSIVINGIEFTVVSDPEVAGKTFAMQFDFKLV